VDDSPGRRDLPGARRPARHGARGRADRTGKGQEIPVNYLLLREGSRWKVYDVVIEGISLVSNYRSQFASILERSSFPELMRKLKATVGRQEQG
jgi:hypothetical protein